MRPTEFSGCLKRCILLLSSICCTAIFAAEKADFVELGARMSSRDVKIPKSLVERIERGYRDFLKKAENGSGNEAINRGLINVLAEFTQERKAALRQNTRVVTPLGGGVVDLSEVVLPLRGSFNVKIKTSRGEGKPLENPHVYFVSRAKARSIDGETYGAGCDKFMDISPRFFKTRESHGFDLYTADQRYLSILGGTFIFVDYAKEALYVGGVTFTDSRYPNLMCD